MQYSYVIGIDIGTGSTKAVAVDENANVLCTAQRFYASIADGEKSEQDAWVVFDAFRQTIKEIATGLKMPPLAVSLSSAMHSVLAVDEKGEPLTPAILWSDKRSGGIAEALRKTAEGEAIYLATGTPIHSMSPLCKIRWLRQNEPAIFSQAAKFISVKEFIWSRLFNEYAIDYSLASATGLFNVHGLRWEEEALNFAGIGPQQLSVPVSMAYTQSGMKTSVADELALPKETPFVIGASDGALANLGSLCFSPSVAAVTIGTSAAVRITSPKPVQDAQRMIFNYRLDDETFVCGGAVNNGGNVFQWLLQNLFSQHKEVTTYEHLFGVLSTVAPGSDGLLFLPYLHGERAPVWDERSCGVFIGLTSSHTLAHLAKAAAEGVCFALRHVLTSLEDVCGEIKQLSVSGGLVHSVEMMQLLADVTGKRVVLRQTEDASAAGAVYLAQKTFGIINDYLAIEGKEAATFQPQTAAVETYRTLFFVYKNLYPLLKDSMHLLYQFSR